MQAPSNTPFFQLPKAVKLTVITVTLDDGTVVDRDPKDLVRLPAALTLPLATFVPPAP